MKNILVNILEVVARIVVGIIIVIAWFMIVGMIVTILDLITGKPL